jgi:protein-tyrosine-phosphatase
MLIGIALEHSFNISKLLTGNDFYQFDLIVSLEPRVHSGLLDRKPPDSTTLIVEFVPHGRITNPWHCPYSDHLKMYKEIEQAM